MIKYPSIAEHNGLYNVEPDNYRRGLIAPEHDFNEYYQNVEDLPFLGERELKAIVAETYACLRKYARVPGHTAADAQRFYEFTVDENLGDRTVKIWLPDIRMLTPQLVEIFQDRILYDNPLWRILIGTDETSHVIYIYPDIVRVGFADEDADWRSELNAIVRQEWDHRMRQNGPDLRQQAYLRSKLPSVIAVPSRKLFETLAIFDNCRGDHSEWTVWICFAGENSDDFTIGDGEGLAIGDNFPVREDGYFGPKYYVDTAKYWMRGFVALKSYSAIPVIRQKEYQPIPGQVFEIPIDPSKVIRDEDLVRDLPPFRFDQFS